MDSQMRVEALRSAGKRALESQDDLFAAWRGIEPADFGLLGTSDDVELLQQLIYRRIYPVNAFEALANIDKASSIDVLISRYLGKRVDPDNKFGGYSFELSCMLDDLREVGGESALRDLIHDSRFNRERLSDKRVVDAFADALEIEPSQFADWVTRKEE